jgi:predicted nucleic acid-binding Zn finger protein
VEFEHRYAGESHVTEKAGASALSFAPDLLRPPTFFRGALKDPVAFREAMSALHDVVVSDLRFKPKDRSRYLAWRAQQADVELVAAGREQVEAAREIELLRAEIAPLEAKVRAAREPFDRARARYWRYLYERDRELWFKLDPVISVHPDQVFFECFSRDESSYGCLAATYEAFEELGERGYGTTNIDYSDGLYAEFQKLRSYKRTSLDVDPSGFSLATSGEAHREVKIDVPDSWVRGFLQVSSAMTMQSTCVELHPMDIHNVCLVLRRNKELFGPRSLRYRLRPGEPVVIVVEPWNIEVRCPRSIFKGPGEHEIRVWGRRRLHILERLLSRARRVRVYLLGTGLPSFYVADLGELSFTLGLSGWTKNDWSASGNFDLMAAREDVDDDTRQRIFARLGEVWVSSAQALARDLELAEPVVASGLAGWVQAGRAIYDLEHGVYRKRELSRDPLPAAALRFGSAREEEAARILHQGKVAVDEVTTNDGRTQIAGRVQYQGRVREAWFVLDADRRLVDGHCSCDYFVRNKLHRGPCDHLLALRAAERRGISDLIELRAASPSGRRARPDAASPRRDNSRGTSALSRGPASLWDKLILFWKRFISALFGG